MTLLHRDRGRCPRTLWTHTPKSARGRCGQGGHPQHSNTALEEILKQGHCRRCSIKPPPQSSAETKDRRPVACFHFHFRCNWLPSSKAPGPLLLRTTAHNFLGPRALLPARPAASIPSEFCNTQLNQNGVWHSGHGKGRRTASPNAAECQSHGDPSPPQSRALGSLSLLPTPNTHLLPLHIRRKGQKGKD